MGNAVLKNPRVVTVTDPVFGPRREAQADLYDHKVTVEIGRAGGPDMIRDIETFICVVSLGKPVEFVPDEEEPAPPSTFRPTT